MTPPERPVNITMNPHLFVYGTLKHDARSGYGASSRRQLHRECRVLGPARLAGTLYDLGRYPGVVVDEAGGGTVLGEILRLADPARTLLWLDRYEGIGVPPAEDDEYVRRLRPVLLDGGATIEAWAYVMTTMPVGATLIPGGIWPALDGHS
jgi:gamma-glutamylcyclotransferase (GGCT)/AIG2-like uncharacterized protein YtfP